MNVFILSTGRCGSTTFERACQFIENYTAGHETRTAYIGARRVAYPDNHIESDNRLSWFLGRLEKVFGDRAFYVHLKRDREAVARSYARRFRPGWIMNAYANGILLKRWDIPEHAAATTNYSALDLAYDYVDTVNENIEAFLQNKTGKMTFNLENAGDHFTFFWKAIGACGDLPAALEVMNRRYNSSVD